MNTDGLVRSILQKESLDHCSTAELQAIARQYTYFTPAQFLLAEKLRSGDPDLYNEQLRKLSLYVNNPLWLDFLLNGYQIEGQMEVDQQKLAEQSMEGSIQRENGERQNPSHDTQSHESTHVETPNEIRVGTAADAELSGTVAEEVPEQPVGSLEEPREEPAQENWADSATVEQKAATEAVEQESEHPFEPTGGVHAEPVQEIWNDHTSAEAKAATARVEQVSEHSIEAIAGGDAEPAQETGRDDATIEAEAAGGRIEQVSEHSIESKDESTEEPQHVIHDDVAAATNETHAHISLPDRNQEAGEQEITFEPYHTVDYFASQGIKFVPEDKPLDRFGQQLKSFTEWLKAMKKLPEAEAIRVSDLHADAKVQQLADHSISEEDVNTEAMAEVWLKQGNKEKAIAVYDQLSLLNPAKSAYFASLIERLKNS